MSKNLTIGFLLDFYGQLLTEKQQDTLDLYYNQDLSLGEIAEYMNITRQGVRDSIKRGEQRLSEYEQTLGLARRFSDISERFRKMDELLKQIDISVLDDNVKKQLKEIKKISESMKENL